MMGHSGGSGAGELQPAGTLLRAPAMLDAIREFFDQHIGAAESSGDDRHAIEVATAALIRNYSALGPVGTSNC